ncbi:MAG: hypothetical protein AAF215_05500 [Cyanobacteria bacterium P01_A01_bin.123]
MIFTTRRETFDEWAIGRYRVQFFESHLWRLGVRFRWLTRQVIDMPRVSVIEKPYGWVLSLPTMAIRVERNG